MPGLAEAGKRLWRGAVPYQLRKATHLLVQYATTVSPETRALRVVRRKRPSADPSGALMVSGLFQETKGVSQIARLTVAGLRLAGFDPLLHDLGDTLRCSPDGGDHLPDESTGGVWILHANPPEAVRALLALDSSGFDGKRRIGHWNWELPRVPSTWTRLAPAFDEIWAPTQFVKNALIASRVSVPLRVVPPPVALDALSVAADRAAFGIHSDVLAVLAMGDLNSSADRKNLIGAIEIYSRAFSERDGRTILVIKTQGDDAHPSFKRAAATAVGSRRDIVFVAGSLPQAKVHSLIASCDVLLSPHRSEGFGLSLAEAFLLGVPALATGWSGNLDFMASTPELLIDFRLIPASDAYGVYAEGKQVWADPDVDDAVSKLRALAESTDLRARLATRGCEAVMKLSRPWQPGGEIEQLLRSYVRDRSG